MNIELINKVIKSIEENPEQFRMDDFGVYDEDNGQYQFCIAGWAIVHGEFNGSQSDALNFIENGPCCEIASYASELLECSPYLFYYSSWPEHLSTVDKYEYHNEISPTERVKLAIEVINYFTENNEH